MEEGLNACQCATKCYESSELLAKLERLEALQLQNERLAAKVAADLKYYKHVAGRIMIERDDARKELRELQEQNAIDKLDHDQAVDFRSRLYEMTEERNWLRTKLGNACRLLTDFFNMAVKEEDAFGAIGYMVSEDMFESMKNKAEEIKNG